MTLSIPELELAAAKSRRNVIRMLETGVAGHLGGALSSIDFITACYFHAMNIDPANPKDPDRDRFLLSAGHKAMGQYAVLAERGFFDKSVLDTYGEFKTKLPGHPNMYYLPGIEGNTGALGHGLPIGVGMALGLRDQGKDAKVFIVMGDGELPEGSNWEGAAAAAHHKVDNIVVFNDINGLQISGDTSKVMDMEPIADKWEAFGWSVKTVDGNDMAELVEALDAAPFEKGKPSVIIGKTIKSKGLSFAEDNAAYHHWAPTKVEGQLEQAIRELDDKIAELEKEVAK